MVKTFEVGSKAYRLLGLLQEYAPNAGAQQDCTNMYNSAIEDGADEKELEILLVGAIGDGLKYGNWPWAKK